MRPRTEQAKHEVTVDHERQMAHFLSFRQHYESQPTTLTTQIEQLEHRPQNNSQLQQVQQLKQLRAAKISFYAEHFPLIQAQLESLFECRLRKLDDSQKQLERVVDLEETLQTTIECKLAGFESAYEKWSVDDTLQWLRVMNDAHFANDGCAQFLAAVRKMAIDGARVADLNSSLLLQMMGLELPSDRDVVRSNVNRVVAHRVDCAYKNRCGICTEAHVNTVMLPCGHQFFCRDYADASDVVASRCPVCRQRVSEVRQTYMAGFSKLSPNMCRSFFVDCVSEFMHAVFQNVTVVACSGNAILVLSHLLTTSSMNLKS